MFDIISIKDNDRGPVSEWDFIYSSGEYIRTSIPRRIKVKVYEYRTIFNFKRLVAENITYVNLKGMH